MLWLLFIAITTYGTCVHTGVEEEKSSRVVEVLLAAAALLTLSLVPQVRRPARHGLRSPRPSCSETSANRLQNGGGLPYARTRVFAADMSRRPEVGLLGLER
jgi:hypothetical protein